MHSGLSFSQRRVPMTRRPLILLAAVFVLVTMLAYAFVAEAKPSGGNNSLSAKACQKGGYLKLFGSDGRRFASESECSSYAAMGGVLSTTPPPPPTPVPTPAPRQPVDISLSFTEALCLNGSYGRGLVLSGFDPVPNEALLLEVTGAVVGSPLSVPITSDSSGQILETNLANIVRTGGLIVVTTRVAATGQLLSQVTIVAPDDTNFPCP
jgi:hypothetical protein